MSRLFILLITIVFGTSKASTKDCVSVYSDKLESKEVEFKESGEIDTVLKMESWFLTATAAAELVPMGKMYHRPDAFGRNSLFMDVDFIGRAHNKNVAVFYVSPTEKKVKVVYGLLRGIDFTAYGSMQELRVKNEKGEIVTLNSKFVRMVFANEFEFSKVATGRFKGTLIGKKIALTRQSFKSDLETAKESVLAFIDKELASQKIWEPARIVSNGYKHEGGRVETKDFSYFELSDLAGKEIIGIRSKWEDHVEIFSGTLERVKRGFDGYILHIRRPDNNIVKVETSVDVVHQMHFLD